MLVEEFCGVVEKVWPRWRCRARLTVVFFSCFSSKHVSIPNNISLLNEQNKVITFSHHSASSESHLSACRWTVRGVVWRIRPRCESLPTGLPITRLVSPTIGGIPVSENTSIRRVVRSSAPVFFPGILSAIVRVIGCVTVFVGLKRCG